MCGRYVTVTSVKAIEKRFQVTAGPGYTDAPPPPNTNVSHGDAAPVITGDQPKALQAMQFGFTPSWWPPGPIHMGLWGVPMSQAGTGALNLCNSAKRPSE